MGADAAGGEFTVVADNEPSQPFTAINSEEITLFMQISNNMHLLAGEQKLRINITKTPSFTLNKLVFSIATAVHENTSDQITIYPNPANDQVIVKGITGASSMNIYDISGSLVKTVQVNESENIISIDKLADGLYILKCTDARNSFCLRLIKKNE
jgi:hypothetical protein